MVCRDRREYVGLADVFHIDEVGAKKRIGDLFRLIFGLGPFGQLLGKAAVVRHLALGVERQAFAIHVDFHALIARDDLRSARASFLGGFRMQRKVSEFDRQIVLSLEFLDTPGDEVAPRSNEIGENFKNQRLHHDRLLSFIFDSTGDRREKSKAKARSRKRPCCIDGPGGFVAK